MASYSVILKPSVEKDLRSKPKNVIHHLWQKIESLASKPLPSGVVKLSGSESLYRLRIGDYRIIYSIDHKARQVIIHYVRHRKEAYR